MIFGATPTQDSEGTILAHSVQLSSGKRLRKGVRLERAAVAQLLDSGIDEVIVARLEPTDIHEDEASTRIASWLINQNVRGDEAFTGRVNLYANHSGIFEVDGDAIDAFNAIDPAITIATLKNKVQVLQGTMVATIKIIPYAVTAASLEAVGNICSTRVLTIHPFRKKRVGLIATQLPTLSEKVVKKTQRVLEQRLVPSGSKIVESLTVNHRAQDVRDAVRTIEDRCDLIIIFGASAISDTLDVIPTGLRQAGGDVLRFGMPVDPGNLLMLGKIRDKDVIGAPGCARSPTENGFDWVLQRVLADLPMDSDLIATMGVGGLLKEISSRPQPRQGKAHPPQNTLAAVVLAAGQSRRMGRQNKLTAKLDGKSLVRTVVDAAISQLPSAVTVVTGHQSDAVKAELSDMDVTFVHNAQYAEGLSTSLAAGIKSLPKAVDGALILLGDMPRITGADIRRLADAFEASKASAIVVATHDGKRGNPVLWPRVYFEALTTIRGDVGARHLLGENEDNVVEVELGRAASFDIDTPEILASAADEIE